MSRIFKKNGWGVNFSHLFFFNKLTLSKLLQQTGFTPTQTHSVPRYLSIKYFNQRLQELVPLARQLFKWFCKTIGCENVQVKLNMFDQIGMFARKHAPLN